MWGGRRRRRGSSSSNSSPHPGRRRRAYSRSWGRREADEQDRASREHRSVSHSRTRRRRRRRSSHNDRRGSTSRSRRRFYRRRRSYTYERSMSYTTSSSSYDRKARHRSRSRGGASRRARERTRHRSDQLSHHRDSGRRAVSTQSTSAATSRPTVPARSAPQPVLASKAHADSKQKANVTSELTGRAVTQPSSPRTAALAEQRRSVPHPTTPVKPITQDTSSAVTPLRSPLSARVAATPRGGPAATAANAPRQPKPPMPLLRDDAAYVRWLCGVEDVTGAASVAPRTPPTAISLTLLSVNAASSLDAATAQGHEPEVTASGKEERRARAELRALRQPVTTSTTTSLATAAPQPTVDWREVGPEKPFFVTSDYEALRRAATVLSAPPQAPASASPDAAATLQTATDALPDWRGGAREVFRRHFCTGKVHPKPPWYLCATAEANCEHPYYIDWLDTVDILPLQEQLTLSRRAMAGSPGTPPPTPPPETGGLSTAAETTVASDKIH